MNRRKLVNALDTIREAIESRPEPAPARRTGTYRELTRDEAAARIRAAREAIGINQSEAARRLGVHVSTYAQCESGKRTPTWLLLHRIVGVLGLDLRLLWPEAFDRDDRDDRDDGTGAATGGDEPPAPARRRRGGARSEQDADESDVDRVLCCLESLPNRERSVLKLRHGLEGIETYSLIEIGRIFKTTRERVRQVEARAVHKLAVAMEMNWGPEAADKIHLLLEAGAARKRSGR